MEIYLVGGCVRDRYIREIHRTFIAQSDRDWVVVGATPQEMIKKGYLPVGRDFPVFLHPQTHEEYALARTERKVARGYHGFKFHASPDVTLREDLKRRDLTINAMAMASDKLFDPYHGLEDIKTKTLRHVSSAFKEDPVRILRVARFCAKLGDFTIAPETLAFMKEMVQNGEANTLVAERIFQEMRKAINERHPERFVETILECELQNVVFPGLIVNETSCSMLKKAAARQLTEAARFAVLTAQTTNVDALAHFLKVIRVPSDIAELAKTLHRTMVDLGTTPKAMLQHLEGADAFRRPERYKILLTAVEVLFGQRPARRLKAMKVAMTVDTATIAKDCLDRTKIAQEIRNARLIALEKEFGA